MSLLLGEVALSSVANAMTAGIVNISAQALPFVRGVSPAMCALERVIAEVAPTDVPVLVIGESGTGKEVVALEIHRRSKSAGEPFVKCSCAGLAAESLRNHLSISASGGLGGTTFFDDIGRLDSANQSLLLQFLAENPSPSQTHGLRDRVISSTTRNLEEETRAGRFREELYYRITGVCLRLPCLHQRQEDVPLLLDHFLKKYACAFGRPEPRLSSTAMQFLARHSWPGNVRELENLARKFVILGDEELALSDLIAARGETDSNPRHAAGANNHSSENRSLKAAARQASRSVERELILNSLERTHWNRKRTARELQISYKALLYKLKQLEIDCATGVEQEPAQAPR